VAGDAHDENAEEQTGAMMDLDEAQKICRGVQGLLR